MKVWLKCKNQFGWRSLDHRTEDARVIMLYKIIHGLVAIPLPSYFNMLERHDTTTPSCIKYTQLPIITSIPSSLQKLYIGIVFLPLPILNHESVQCSRVVFGPHYAVCSSFCRNLRHASKETMTQTYVSMIRSNLDYCCANPYHHDQKLQMEMVQRISGERHVL